MANPKFNVGRYLLYSDEDYIRDVDYKAFCESGNDYVPNNAEGARMISDMLKQEYKKDFKLSRSGTAVNNVPRSEFPFNRHTVTIGVGNVVVDFEKARTEHEEIKKKQAMFAEEIERAKEEMERVRLVEQAWFDDYQNSSIENDVSIDKTKRVNQSVSNAEQSERGATETRLRGNFSAEAIHTAEQDIVKAIEGDVVEYEDEIETAPSSDNRYGTEETFEDLGPESYSKIKAYSQGKKFILANRTQPYKEINMSNLPDINM